MVALDADYFRELETPRMALLSANLVAAVFPLMKLMPARYILDRAAADGSLRPGYRIVESTSGTFGMALALLAAARGYRLTLVTASSLIDAKYRARLEGSGATIIVTEDPDGNGDQVRRLQELQRIRSEEPHCFWPRQYDNPQNALSYAGLAETLVRSMGRIDCLVGCVGSGGSLCGTGAFLRMIFPQMSIIAVDTHRSILFGQPVGSRLLRGLGNSVLPANLDHELVDEVHWVGAYPAFRGARDLLREHGIFQGPTSAAAALVARWTADNRPGARVAVIMPDEGHRYADTVFDDAWLASLPEWPSASPSKPRMLTTLEPASETEWTRFAWARRSLDQVRQAHSMH